MSPDPTPRKEVGAGGVQYTPTEPGFFAKRALRRYARVGSLWALGVGAVISGHYSGWNFGLQQGFGSMLVALLVIAAMYWGLILSLAELSPALPHTGGAYSFARSAMGPWGGMVTGLAESIEYVLTPAVIAFFIGSYMTAIFETPPGFQPLWWVGTYAFFLFLNLRGVELSFKVSVVVTLGALAVLAIYYVSAVPHFDLERWALNVDVDVAIDPAAGLVELPSGGGRWFPAGATGILQALPFAVWLFLAIEQLPLAAEESQDPQKDMPKGLILGMATLMASALLVLFLNAGVGSTEPGKQGLMRGTYSLATSAEPLLDGFRVVYGTAAAKLLAFLAVIGLIASFHTILFAYGRQLYSLSRAGYYMRALSLTHGVHKVPHVALYAGAILGLGIMLVVWLALGSERGGAAIGGMLLNMAVFGAMVSYAMQGLSFILLRVRRPALERPFKSPVGIPGAIVTIGIALVTLGAQMKDPTYRNGVAAAVGCYALGLLYFAAIGRKRLILSPEEEFALAMTSGARGTDAVESVNHTGATTKKDRS